MEVVYEVEESEPQLASQAKPARADWGIRPCAAVHNRIAGIDIGIDNLACVTSNVIERRSSEKPKFPLGRLAVVDSCYFSRFVDAIDMGG